MSTRSIALFFKEGRSDKVYNASIDPASGGYVVNFSYGRRGSTLQTGTKTPKPVSLDEATAAFQKLVKEKMGKGYTEGACGVPYVGTSAEPRTTGILPQLLNPVDVADAAQYMNDPRCCLQEKFDGKRVLLKKEKDGEVLGINRRGLTFAIPEPLQRAARAIPGAFLLDGEALGERYVAFDCLERDGNLRTMAFEQRRMRMPVFAKGSPISEAATAFTAYEKRKFFTELQARGAEGAVFKRIDAPYTPGRPSKGGPQLKIKFTATASVIVAGTNGSKRSVKMELYDGKQQRVAVGSVTVPPNAAVPKAGAVIEVRYLYAYPGGALYQPVFIHQRDDVLPAECGIGQLKYKPAEEDGDE